MYKLNKSMEYLNNYTCSGCKESGFKFSRMWTNKEPGGETKITSDVAINIRISLICSVSNNSHLPADFILSVYCFGLFLTLVSLLLLSRYINQINTILDINNFSSNKLFCVNDFSFILPPPLERGLLLVFVQHFIFPFHLHNKYSIVYKSDTIWKKNIKDRHQRI